ncbi:putative esterase [Peziza echinospora]|nr:putative esterase [Peziza echinospora]
MSYETVSQIRSFGGYINKIKHNAPSIGDTMTLNLYLPPQAEHAEPGTIPVLIYLSGLTCTPDNCAEKGGFQATASKRGVAIVWPDTSPRGAKIDGEDASYDFGWGAGFYVDATQDPWSREYKMYSYVTKDLPAFIFEEFKVLNQKKVGITGHSMGGHGALTLYLKNPGVYSSVSAFAPILNPMNCPWGQKAFLGYFGDRDQDSWKAHDATELVREHKGKLNVLIDVGTNDKFYKQGQLLPENFDYAVEEAGAKGEGYRLRYQEGYDHSYYFVATFAEEHVNYHADLLLK